MGNYPQALYFHLCLTPLSLHNESLAHSNVLKTTRGITHTHTDGSWGNQPVVQSRSRLRANEPYRACLWCSSSPQQGPQQPPTSRTSTAEPLSDLLVDKPLNLPISQFPTHLIDILLLTVLKI